jgi:hypothetical protein
MGSEDACPKYHQNGWDDPKCKHDPINHHLLDGTVGLNIGGDSTDEEVSQVMDDHSGQQAVGFVK